MSRDVLIETPNRIYGLRKNLAEEVLSRDLGSEYVCYRKRWIKASSRKLVTEFPLYIQIEHTGKCNLRCPTCVQGISPIRDMYSKGFTPLSLNLYKKILDEAERYKCPSISFHNNDEPLLLEDIEKRIGMAGDAGFLDIILTTNATLLTKEKARGLLNSGLTKINFSIDAFREADYKKRRIKGNFNTVLKNIEYFLEERKKAGLKIPVTRATCILTRYSFRDMEAFREFWSKKVDMVEFQNFQAITGRTEQFRPDGAKIDRDFTCNAPWQQMVIRANGDILPCCSFYGIEMALGNIKTSSIYDIWNGFKMKKIRRELLKNNFNFSAACKKCSNSFYAL